VVEADQVVHARQADLAHLGEQCLGLGQRRGVAAHVADLDDRARALGGGNHLVAFARAQAHRLLDQHVLAVRDRGERGVGVERVGIADQHRVDVVERGEVVVVGQAPLDAPEVADAVEHGAADVAQRGDLEAA
jgi:hypothetical protein